MSSAELLALQLLRDAGLEGYVHTLEQAGDSGMGRIKAMQWQVIHAHLMIRRRIMCREAGRDFYEVEKTAEAAVKRLKTGDPWLDLILVYVHYRKQLRGDKKYWDEIRATILGWSTS